MSAAANPRVPASPKQLSRAVYNCPVADRCDCTVKPCARGIAALARFNVQDTLQGAVLANGDAK